MPTAECLLGQSATTLPARDIEVTRGDDVVLVFHFIYQDTGANYDWTGWTFAAKMKAAVDGALWSTATVTHDGTGGTITILFPSSDTTLLIPGAEGKWDLQGTDPGTLVRTIIRGDVLVIGDIT